jgi:hypothetical protein
MEAKEPGFLGCKTAELLIETKPQALPAPKLRLGNDLASKVIRCMQDKGYTIFNGANHYNIVYLEGVNEDGTPNNDASNEFNDRRLVIEIKSNSPEIVGNWRGTTEPGYYYTYNPMNAKGAARIAFGQYKAWVMGWHGTASPHEALVQEGGVVTVHRDFNQDLSRSGDSLDTGWFGINQHWGYDYATNDVHNASAGCLLGQMWQGHQEFIDILKDDRRYRLNPNYIFYTTVIDGSQLS